MKFILCFVGLLMARGCAAPQSASPDSTQVVSQGLPEPQPAQATTLPGTPGESSTVPQPAPEAGRKIVRNATIDFEVADFRASVKHITTSVRAFNGRVSDDRELRENDVLRSQMTIRVPASRLDAFVDTLLRESIYTRAKTISAEDVTKQFVDTEARIRSQKATEERYRQLLKQARSVKDVLEVDEQLRAIREAVEIQEAELRTLKDDVAMSTITLTFYQNTDATLAPKSPFVGRLWSNLKSGFSLISGFFLGVVYLLPLLVMLGIGWATGRAVIRWVRSRKPGV